MARGPYLGIARRAWYKRSRSMQASRHRPYEGPTIPHERSTQSSVHRAPSNVWGVNWGAVAHPDKTNGVSARMKSRLMELLLCGNLSPLAAAPPLPACGGPLSVTRRQHARRDDQQCQPSCCLQGAPPWLCSLTDSTWVIAREHTSYRLQMKKVRMGASHGVARDSSPHIVGSGALPCQGGGRTGKAPSAGHTPESNTLAGSGERREVREAQKADTLPETSLSQGGLR